MWREMKYDYLTICHISGVSSFVKRKFRLFPDFVATLPPERHSKVVGELKELEVVDKSQFRCKNAQA